MFRYDWSGDLNIWGNIGDNIVTFFQNYMATDKQQIPEIDITQPNQILANSSDLVKGKLDLISDVFLGDIYFIKVSPDADDIDVLVDGVARIGLNTVTTLLNKLDKDCKSRSVLDAVNYFTSGSFILARADEHARAHHNLYVKCLKRPEFYINSILQTLAQTIGTNQQTDLKSLITKPLRDSLAKGLFELDEIPAELNNAISAFAAIGEDAAADFATNVKLVTSASKLPSWTLGASSSFREIKECYLSSTKTFLFNQKEAIFLALQSYANGRECHNLLALSVIQLIKEQYEVCRQNPESLKSLLNEMRFDDLDAYLSRGEIISIPASITASTNLTILLACSLSALYLNPELKNELIAELKDIGLEKAMEENNIDQIKMLFEENEKKNGLLHRIYLESMRRENLFKTTDHLSTETIQARFTSEAITIEGCGTIPANSTIMFLPGTVRFDARLWADPESFDTNRFKCNPSLAKYSHSIFSQGARQCPARSVSSYIFKSMLCYTTLFADLKLEIGSDARLDKIKVECTQKMLEATIKHGLC